MSDTLHQAAEKVIKHWDAKHVFATQIAIESLRSALAQQGEQQPVAWMHEFEDGEKVPKIHPRDERFNDQPKSVRPLIYGDRAGAAPAAQPDNEADELLRNLGLEPDAYRTDGGYINHLKVKAAIRYPENYPQAQQGRTDQEIVDQTEELAVWLLSWAFNHEPETATPMRASNHPFAQRCWSAACHIQEILTATDPENAVAEIDGFDAVGMAKEEATPPTPHPDARKVIEQMVDTLRASTPAHSLHKLHSDYRDAIRRHAYAIQAGQQWLEENK